MKSPCHAFVRCFRRSLRRARITPLASRRASFSSLDETVLLLASLIAGRSLSLVGVPPLLRDRISAASWAICASGDSLSFLAASFAASFVFLPFPVPFSSAVL